MGWLFDNGKLRHQTPAAYIAQHSNHDNGRSSATVIATATARGTTYAAIRNADAGTGNSYVFAAVILFRNTEKGGFGCKDMDEGMGPCEVDCPDRIMRLLSPVEEIPNPGYAADRRTRVAAARAGRASLHGTAAKLAPGDKVELPHEVRVGTITTDRFESLRFNKRTPIFTPEGQT